MYYGASRLLNLAKKDWGTYDTEFCIECWPSSLIALPAINLYYLAYLLNLYSEPKHRTPVKDSGYT